MALLRLPSVQLDVVAEDILDATAAALVSGNSAPFALANGQTLDVEIDGGAPQTFTFLTADFDDITAATAQEVALVLSSIVGATVTVVGDAVVITTDLTGAAGSVEVTGGTAAAAFAWPVIVTGSDLTDTTLILNQDPEDGEVEVPFTESIRLQVHDTTGAPTALADIGVTVGGVDAVLAGLVQPGFDGAGSGWTLVDASTRELTLVPTTPWTSQQTIEVEVTVGGARPVVATWSFVTEDQTLPEVAVAQGREPKVVRVTFSESVRMVSPSGVADALNPANYLILQTQAPSVPAEVLDVEMVDSSTVDLLLDTELTFGAVYQVVVSSVVDLVGNQIAAPNNSALFAAFSPQWPERRRFMILDWLPDISIRSDTSGDLRRMVSVFQEVLNLLLYTIDGWTRILDPDTAPEDFLDAMLADMGNPFDFVLDEVDKRRLAKLLIEIYRQKGTGVGLVNVIRFFLGITVTIDIYNGGGWELAAADSPTTDGTSPPAGPGDELSSTAEEAPDPATLGPGTRRLLYTFDIISPVNLTDEQRRRMRGLAEYMKPAHTHLNRILEPASAPAPVDHVELGLSELGGGTAGTWILH